MLLLLRLVRRATDAGLAVLVGAVIGLVLLVTVGPLLGHHLVAIRGGSMAPAIPLGALVDEVAAAPEQIRAGDIVTVKAPNGILVTHRVSRIVELADGLAFEVKGDANAAPDPLLRPASTLVGRVDVVLPLAGYLMYLLKLPSGIIAIVGLAGSLLLAARLFEELEADEAELGGTKRRRLGGAVAEAGADSGSDALAEA